MSFDPRLLPSRFEAVPIPPELHSVETGGPFRACLVCGCALDEDTHYLIQKEVRGTECILECALCFECARAMQQAYSEESKRAIQALLPRGLGAHADDRSDDECELCCRPFALVEDYSLLGFCRGPSLVLPTAFLCNGCELELNERLSKETREEHDRFLETHFPGMPASFDLSPGLAGLPT